MSLPASGPRSGATDEPPISALVAERCPACGARLASAAQWCGLCYADLRTAPTVEVGAPAATAASESVRADIPPAGDALPFQRAASPQVTAPEPPADGPQAFAPVARPTWPCSGCGAAVDVDLDSCEVCGTGFLGALRNTSTGIELPMVGNLGRFSDRSRVVLGATAGLLVAFILVVLTALIGR